MFSFNPKVWHESLVPHWTEPFIVNSVSVCVPIPPVASLVKLNKLKPNESFTLICAPGIPLLFVEFVTFIVKYHCTVMLFFSVGKDGSLGMNATLDLLK